MVEDLVVSDAVSSHELDSLRFVWVVDVHDFKGGVGFRYHVCLFLLGQLLLNLLTLYQNLSVTAYQITVLMQSLLHDWSGRCVG